MSNITLLEFNLAIQQDDEIFELMNAETSDCLKVFKYKCLTSEVEDNVGNIYSEFAEESFVSWLSKDLYFCTFLYQLGLKNDSVIITKIKITNSESDTTLDLCELVPDCPI